MKEIYADNIFEYNSDSTIKCLKDIEKLDAENAKTYLLNDISVFLKI